MSQSDIRSRHERLDISPTSRRAVENLALAGVGRSLEERRLVEVARRFIKLRKRMGEFIPKNLVKDWAWDIFLELFVNGEEGGIVYVKHLMLTCNTTPTSAMRLIDRIEDAGLIERSTDYLDQRRVIIKLSDRGREAMIAILRDASAWADRDIAADAPRPFTPRPG
ncbi:hypothetical protein [Pelagerythrobacter marensis]|nr:hypothetical protein [Pelagerythrobacter marensis]